MLGRLVEQRSTSKIEISKFEMQKKHKKTIKKKLKKEFRT